MTIESVIILLGIGLLGGALNAVAGGAMLFTFPALMAVGLTPIVATATNFLALLPSNAAALPAYRKELQEVGSALIPLFIVSGIGAITGSLLLTVSDPAFFMDLIPLLILMATALFAFGERLRDYLLNSAGVRSGNTLVYIVLFAASVYGGYFGAGLGIILLAIAQIMGYTSFHMANAVKNLLGTSFTIIGVIIFGFSDLIAWPEALTMMVGSTIGGYFGGYHAKRVNERYLRLFIIVFGVVLSGIYFYKNL